MPEVMWQFLESPDRAGFLKQILYLTILRASSYFGQDAGYSKGIPLKDLRSCVKTNAVLEHQILKLTSLKLPIPKTSNLPLDCL